MKDVKTLLERRDKLFEDQTVAALGMAEETLIGIREYLISVDTSYSPGTFIWEDVSLFEGELLMLIGHVSYDPGVSFMLDGQKVEITKDNKDYFDRMLRIGIPLAVVNQKSKDVVVGFLVNLRNAIDEDGENDLLIDIGEELEGEVEEVTDESESKYDFNLDELTEEQRHALNLSRKSGKLN